MPSAGPHVLVVAKEPVPGRVKTRLQPTCSPGEAAAVAEAALADTLEAVAACGAARRVLALDGRPGPWLPEGFEVVPQCDGTLDRRLAGAWDRAGGPGLQVGMDTPQVTPALLDQGLGLLDRPGVGAVLGPAVDGGWWAIGLREARPDAFLGVPMSTGETGRCQLTRLRSLGLRVGMLEPLLDIDHPEDLVAVASAHPHLRTARAAARVAALWETCPPAEITVRTMA